MKRESKNSKEPGKQDREKHTELSRKEGWTGKFAPSAKHVAELQELRDKYPQLDDGRGGRG